MPMRNGPWGKILGMMLLLVAGFFGGNAALPAAANPAAADRWIYNDALAAGWTNWSWNTESNFGNSTPVLSGTASIAVTYQAQWAGLYLHGPAISTTGYDRIRFWIHGGTTGRTIDFSLNSTPKVPVTLAANTWTRVDVLLSDLGNPTAVGDLIWQDRGTGAQPPFYLDAISLVGEGLPQSVPALWVDAQAGRHTINPYIYGMNFLNEALAEELRLPLRRWGGNATTRYNWQNDTSNRAGDWYFENIPNENSNSEQLPNGSSSDRFVEQDRRTGTDTLLTVPLIGWTPKSRSITCAFSVAKYGAQQETDPYRPDCGRGVRSNGSLITNNDPHDTSTAITPAFVQSWIAHLVGAYGRADAGGVRYYSLDNEPMLWNSTHRDVHPNPVSYDELRDLTYAYAAAIKTTDPTAQTTGPALWGWTAYFYSALDAAPGGNWWLNPQDRNAHGGTPFVEWYLQQMRAYEQQHGVRILDYLDLHFYPQGANVALNPAGSPDVQALRLRSTRALWDPGYRDESWIDQPVYLIPRMKAWVAANYPGTKLALTEYNWGGLESINGAVAQADILGIFGREGLDMATLWDPPSGNQPGAYAFRMYRNYNGTGGAFGETGVRATSTLTDELAVYAALRSEDGALTVMVVNKGLIDQTVPLTLTGFTPASAAQVYRYSGANLNAIVRQSDLTLNAGAIRTTYPASSITLLVIPTARPYTEHRYLPLTVRKTTATR